jgi:hypothetical protein
VFYHSPSVGKNTKISSSKYSSKLTQKYWSCLLKPYYLQVINFVLIKRLWWTYIEAKYPQIYGCCLNFCSYDFLLHVRLLKIFLFCFATTSFYFCYFLQPLFFNVEKERILGIFMRLLIWKKWRNMFVLVLTTKRDMFIWLEYKHV